MSKKTLADELRSVLLDRSLDAPDPDRTVDRILAETVAGTPNATTGSALAGSNPIGGAPTGSWLRRRPTGRLVAAVAAVAVVALGAVVLNEVRQGSADRHRGSAALSAPAGRPAQGQAEGPAISGAPSIGGKPPLQPAGAAAAPPADLSCTAIPGSRPVTGAHTEFTVTATGATRFVYEFYCANSTGQRGGSELQVFAPVGGQLRELATLVPAAEGEHLQSMSGSADGVTVQVTESAGGPGPVAGLAAGSLVRVAWTTSDGGTSWTAQRPQLVAAPCEPATLGVQFSSIRAGASWRLLLTNRAAAACVLEGYPRLQPIAGGKQLAATATDTLRGPAGGVSGSAPPIVLLQPGDAATAVVEVASGSQQCADTDQLAIALPDGALLGNVPAQVTTCGLLVHPLVAGLEGSG